MDIDRENMVEPQHQYAMQPPPPPSSSSHFWANHHHQQQQQQHHLLGNDSFLPCHRFFAFKQEPVDNHVRLSPRHRVPPIDMMNDHHHVHHFKGQQEGQQQEEEEQDFLSEQPESEKDLFTSDSEPDRQMETDDGDHAANLLSLASSFCRYKEQKIGVDIFLEEHFSEDKFTPGKFSEMGTIIGVGDQHLDPTTLDMIDCEDHQPDCVELRSSEDDRVIRERRCNYLQFISSLPKTCSPSICGTLSQNRPEPASGGGGNFYTTNNITTTTTSTTTAITSSQLLYYPITSTQDTNHKHEHNDDNENDDHHDADDEEFFSEPNEVESDQVDGRTKFNWSIDQLATLRPVEISFNERVFRRYHQFEEEDEHNTQEQFCKESEEFFSQERIARSPSSASGHLIRAGNHNNNQHHHQHQHSYDIPTVTTNIYKSEQLKTPARKSSARSFAVVSRCDSIDFQPPSLTHTSTPCVSARRPRKVFDTPDATCSIKSLMESPISKAQRDYHRRGQKANPLISFSPVETRSPWPSQRPFTFTPMSCESPQQRKKLFDDRRRSQTCANHESLLFESSSHLDNSMSLKGETEAKNEVDVISLTNAIDQTSGRSMIGRKVMKIKFSEDEEEEEAEEEEEDENHSLLANLETSHCRTPQTKSRRLRTGCSSLSSSLLFQDLNDEEEEEEEDKEKKDRPDKSVNLSSWFCNQYFSASSALGVELNADTSSSMPTPASLATASAGSQEVKPKKVVANDHNGGDSMVFDSSLAEGEEILFPESDDDEDNSDDDDEEEEDDDDQHMDGKKKNLVHTGLSGHMYFLTTNSTSSLTGTIGQSLSPTQDSGCFFSQKNSKNNTIGGGGGSSLSFTQFEDNMQTDSKLVSMKHVQTRAKSHNKSISGTIF